ncbi:hypothetical protein DPMN_108159 [Dreissena polymorpha]|uniref:Uncharacterized protein n=1 Tax=Dreissena polymorpha TaxID=45954 RepID=A0A9D4QKN4_DREPO|nr:hypothetical protein DPMN_108159 [Dreissena polymorpha]
MHSTDRATGLELSLDRRKNHSTRSTVVWVTSKTGIRPSIKFYIHVYPLPYLETSGNTITIFGDFLYTTV